MAKNSLAYLKVMLLGGVALSATGFACSGGIDPLHTGKNDADGAALGNAGTSGSVDGGSGSGDLDASPARDVAGEAMSAPDAAAGGASGLAMDAATNAPDAEPTPSGAGGSTPIMTYEAESGAFFGMA